MKDALLPMMVEAELMSPLAGMLISDLLPKPAMTADEIMHQAMQQAYLRSLVEGDNE